MMFNKLKYLLVALAMVVSAKAYATTITFGSGVNSFNMDFTPIENPGNVADTTGFPNPAGSVGYVFSMGKHEVSRDMVIKANSLGSLGISLIDMSALGGNGPNRPATGISWFEAAKFANWLNTSTGSSLAYKFDVNGNFQLWQSGDPGFDSTNPFRNSLANYVLPSMNEWHKSAFYDPMTGAYYDYTTGSDTPPTPVAGGTSFGTAVFGQPLEQGPADITNAGGLSPYGVMGLGGNVFEWEESTVNSTNQSPSAVRGLRASNWSLTVGRLSSTGSRGSTGPSTDSDFIGFRIVRLSSTSNVVPEPTSIAIWGLLGVCGLMVRRR